MPVGSTSLLNLQVMGMKSHNGYRYLFLLFEKLYNHPILGFIAKKVVEDKGDNTSALINYLTNNLVNKNGSNVSILVNLISTLS